MNEKLKELKTNANGITYVPMNVKQEINGAQVAVPFLADGDSFEGYLVGVHKDRENAEKITCLILQDEAGGLFGLNCNFRMLKGIDGAGVAKYDQLKAVYGGKKQLDPKYPASHQWEVSKGGSKILPEDSAFGNSAPQTINGF